MFDELSVLGVRYASTLPCSRTGAARQSPALTFKWLFNEVREPVSPDYWTYIESKVRCIEQRLVDYVEQPRRRNDPAWL